ncbi:MAG: hypothetical protein KY444_03685, partial [Gemmatimonadetes bacterium]|nr:hypothetical protein [Gemmatimonadota bacterium]
TFVARADQDAVEARIAVLYENRVLQTALLCGPVAGRGGAKRRKARITMTLEAVVHPELARLDERSHFHAALVVNRNADGESRVMAAAGESVAVMGLEGMQQGLKAIRDRLSSTPPTRVGPTENPFGPDVVKLLQFMAYHGRELHDGLLRNNDFSGMLRPATRMQIISAKAESFLPLEFVYDRPSPAADAGMCPNALEAARTGECEACPSLAHWSEAPYICPAGFWALTRVVERHAFDPRTRPKDGAEFTLFNVPAPTRERRELQPLRSALYAASNRVDAGKGKKNGEGLIQRVLEGLTRAARGVGGTASLAPSWAAWKEEVKSRSPTLLVVLSHTATNRDLKAVGLEIAEGDCLLSGHISPAHVAHRATPESPPSTTPVVLLLGCETIAPEIPYQGFVPAFRDAGAAAVICTNSTVLGREVGPAAEQLVQILEEITRSPEPVALGDALLRLRRECFASGMPMALGLVAYGDADWRLTR